MNDPHTAAVLNTMTRQVEDRPPLAAMIVRLRTIKGWTQQELAGRAGISLSFLGMVEAGNRNPGTESLDAICEALGATVSERKTLDRLRRADRAAALKARIRGEDEPDLNDHPANGAPVIVDFAKVAADLERIRAQDPELFASIYALIERTAHRLGGAT